MSHLLYECNVQRCYLIAGGPADKPLIGDYDGDGKTDTTYYRPSPPQLLTHLSGGVSSTACSNLRFALGNNLCYTNFFTTDDLPVTADFDGDGKTDIMWWNSVDDTFRTWGMSGSYCPENFTNQGSFCHLPFAFLGDIPIAKQFNGNAKAEPGVWRNNSGGGFSDWLVRPTGGSNPTPIFWAYTYAPDVYRTFWGLSGDVIQSLP